MKTFTLSKGLGLAALLVLLSPGLRAATAGDFSRASHTMSFHTEPLYSSRAPAPGRSVVSTSEERRLRLLDTNGDGRISRRELHRAGSNRIATAKTSRTSTSPRSGLGSLPRTRVPESGTGAADFEEALPQP